MKGYHLVKKLFPLHHHYCAWVLPNPFEVSFNIISPIVGQLELCNFENTKFFEKPANKLIIHNMKNNIVFSSCTLENILVMNEISVWTM